MKILVIEDTPGIVETITLALEMLWPDAKVISTARGEQGIDMVEKESPDVIILDLGLPDISGYEVLKRIRLFSDIPILILTVRAEELDIVKGLEWGADDYMIKPFKQLELLARIRGVMRRYKPKSGKPLTCGQLVYDPESYKLSSGTTEIRVSRTEGLIIGHLMRNYGNVVSYASLAEAVWGDDFPEASDSLKVHVRHLREKIEEEPSHPKIIITRPGIGYVLVKPS
jgi:two-component system, OmpR family, response regulator VicR